MGVCAVYMTGVELPKSAIVPRTLGWMPNSIVVIALPQSSPIPPEGTLTLVHDANTVTIPQVRIDSFNIRLSTGGHVVYIRAMDRRWRWKFKLISGRYNIRLADGTIDPATQKTTQELASLLLSAMGETGFDVRQLPANGYPEVDWTYDCAALELSQICTERGCDISLNLDNTVSIVQLGNGLLLPADGDIQTVSVTANPAETPGKLLFLCGETQYESLLKLKAVGVDLDGKVKAIDDLSYKPFGGWAAVADYLHMEDINVENVTGLSADDAQRAKQLARKTVYRWYVVESQADGTQEVPGYGAVADIGQLLPLNDFLLDSQTAAAGTKKLNKPAKVIGTFLISEAPDQVGMSKPGTEYEGTWSLAKASGLVRFTKPVVKLDGGVVKAAELYLQTSYGVREDDTQQLDRHVVERVLASGSPSLEAAARYEEIAVAVTASYSTSDPTVVESVEDNETEVESEANAILDALEQRYAGLIYGHGKYRDLKLMNTDGAIRQMMWIVDDRKGANTVMARNSECIPWIPRIEERDRRRLLAQTGFRFGSDRWRGQRGSANGLFRGGGY